MQESFGFAADDLVFIRSVLACVFGRLAPFQHSGPVWRLVRSLIGCRTYDIVAEPALARLKQCWPHPSLLAAAKPADVERVIDDVTYAGDKAKNLVATLQWIGRERPDSTSRSSVRGLFIGRSHGWKGCPASQCCRRDA